MPKENLRYNDGIIDGLEMAIQIIKDNIKEDKLTKSGGRIYDI